MDSFEINKIIAAVLVIFIVIFGITKISDYIYYVEKPAQSAYKVEFAETDTKKSISAQKVDIAALLAMGSIEHGKTVFKKCSACHSIKKGGRNSDSNDNCDLYKLIYTDNNNNVTNILDETYKNHFDELKNLNNQFNFKEISMGMSHDYETAVKYKSTFLRIGSKIFGERN